MFLPGPTRSEGVGDFVRSLAKERGLGEQEMEAAFFHEARPTSLLQRFATVEEVANVIAFVASPLASAINGSALRAEGASSVHSRDEPPWIDPLLEAHGAFARGIPRTARELGAVYSAASPKD